MKPSSLLLSLSLAANLGCIAWLVTRSAPGPAALPAAKAADRSPGPAHAAALRAALASGNAAELEAAGVAPEIARELALGRSFSRLAEGIRSNRATSDGRWWRNRPGQGSTDAREHQLVARRKLADALVAAFGDDFGLGGSDNAQLAFLSPEKRDALRRILQDYDEMMAKFGTGGIQLASDREKLRLLRAERDRDIAGLLTPEERLAYEMRSSPTGNMVRNRYGDAIESEAEFQKIYALQKAFDEKFPRESLIGRISPETMRARSEAERQLDADLRAAVGEDRYAALRRAADPDLRTIDSLASRLNLPPATTDAVVASRDAYAAESQRITNDSSLSIPDRRAQIQALASQAKADLTKTLGAEAADAYAQRSPWVSMLQNGMAYSTTPQDSTPGSLLPGPSQSVYPVLPAGAIPAGARQFVVNATPPIDGPIGTDGFTGSNVQVMTFSSSSFVDPNAAPGSAPNVRRVIVAPGATPPPAQPTPPPRP